MSDFAVSIDLLASDKASGVIKGIQSAIGGLISSISAVSGIAGGLSFSGLAASGIQFNKTMEDTRGGLGALILSTTEFRDSQGKLLTGQDAVNAAFTKASGIQKQLVQDAKTSAASYTDLVGAFQTAYGPATAAGITNLDKLRQITLSASNATAALGLDSRQLSQEMRALFTGEQGPDNKLNTTLGITKAQLDAVRKSGGDVADFLLAKLQPFQDAATASTANFTIALSNLKDSFEQMAGEVSKPIFDALKDGIGRAGVAVADAKETLLGMGVSAATVLKALMPLGESLVRVGIVAFDAGLKFSESLTPVVPLLTKLADGVAYVLSVLGPWGPGIYVGVVALQALSGAVSALTAAGGLAALGGALTGLLNPITAVGVGLGALVLAYRAWKTESDAATTAVANSQKGLITQFGEIEDRALRLGKTGLAEWAADWADRIANGTASLDDGSKALHDYAKSGDVAAKSVGGVGTALTETQKPLADNAAAAKKLGDAYKKIMADIRDELRVFTTPIENRAIEKIRIDGEEEMKKLKATLRATSTDIEQLSRVTAFKIAAAYKAVPVEVQTNTDAAFASIKKLGGETIVLWDTTGQTLKSHAKDLADDLSRLFEDGFFAVLEGRFSGLGDILSSFSDSVVKTFARDLSKMVSQIGKTKEQIAAQGGPAMAGYGAADYAQAGLAVGASYFGNATGGAQSFGQGFSPYLSAASASIGIGSLFGPIGTVVGVVVAAVIAVIGLIVNLVAPDTEKHIYLRGKSLLQQGESKDRFGGVVQGTVEGFQRLSSSLADIAGLDSGSRRSMAEAINKGLLSYIENMDWEVHAGSEEDLKADVDNLLKGVIPSEMLHQLFGNIRLGGQDLPGISGGSKYGQGIADQNAPIAKFLKDLGFTVEAIGTLSTKIDSMDPEKFMEYLKGLVGVVVGFGDLGKKLRATTWGEFQSVLSQRAADANNPVKQFSAAAEHIKDLGAELNLYTGEEKIRRAQELNQLGEQYYESMVQYMASLKAMAENIDKSINTQIKGFQYGLLDDGGKQAFLNKEIQSLYAELQNAKDPTRVADLVQQIQQNLGLLGGINGNSQNAVFVEWATKLLNSVNAFAQGAISNAGADVAALNDKYGLGPFFEGLKKDFTTFSQGFSELADPDKRPVRDLDEFGARTANAGEQADRMAQKANGAAASLEGFAAWIDFAAGRLGAFAGALNAPATTGDVLPASTQIRLQRQNASIFRPAFGR